VVDVDFCKNFSNADRVEGDKKYVDVEINSFLKIAI
jgi:hypothetical protein